MEVADLHQREAVAFIQICTSHAVKMSAVKKPLIFLGRCSAQLQSPHIKRLLDFAEAGPFLLVIPLLSAYPFLVSLNYAIN